jgi:hypothetical protein
MATTQTAESQVKKTVSMTLSPEAIQGLDVLAKVLNLSRSALVDSIGRGEILVQISARALDHRLLGDQKVAS